MLHLVFEVGEPMLANTYIPNSKDSTHLQLAQFVVLFCQTPLHFKGRTVIRNDRKTPYGRQTAIWVPGGTPPAHYTGNACFTEL